MMHRPIAYLLSLHVRVPDADIDASHTGLSRTTINASALHEHRLPCIKSKLATL